MTKLKNPFYSLASLQVQGTLCYGDAATALAISFLK